MRSKRQGQNATPPTLSAKDGYTLSWDADYTNITEDMVINAVWTKNDSGNGGGNTTNIVSPSETTKYTVTFKDRGKIVKTEKVNLVMQQSIHISIEMDMNYHGTRISQKLLQILQLMQFGQ